MDYDVIIAGGGPSGSTAAYHLAKEGVRVLLVDKSVFPRDKVCGDGIAPRSVRSLYNMGLRDRIESEFNKFHGFIFAGAGKSMLKSKIPKMPTFPDHGYIIPRIKLDKILLDKARETGAEIWESCEVTRPLVSNGRVTGVALVRDGKEMELTSGAVIGADGAHSVLGSHMKLLVNDPAYLGLTMRQYFEGVRGIGDYLEIYPAYTITPAAGWVFPITATHANVGVGAMLYHIRKKKISIAEYFDRLVNKTPMVTEKLKDAHPVSTRRGGLIRVGLGASKVECPGLLLVGEAASTTNPVSGEGIPFAMESGEMAAKLLLHTQSESRGFHHDPEEYSFRKELAGRYQDYFNKGLFCIRWGNRPVFMKPLLNIAPRKQYFSDYMISALMCIRHP